MAASINTSDGVQSSQHDYPPSPVKSFVNRTKNLSSQIQLPPSPANSDGQMQSSCATTREENRITRDLERGTPGDQAIFSEHKTAEQRELAKKRSQYFESSFASREPNLSARERVMRESIITADVRTNVIIQDEYTFITDLSYALSTRYQRPENCILVTVTHSCCLLFGGTFDPAYILNITALPSQLQPVTNKRNAALIAKSMEEGLGVGPERGIIKFTAIAEENLATNGKTVAGEIEQMEKEFVETNGGLHQSNSKATNKSGKRRQSMKSLRGLKTSQLATHVETSPTPPTSAGFQSPPLPAIPTESVMDQRADKVRRMGRRKSFIATIFGKAG